MGAEYKGDLLIWYQANKVTADRIVNDLKKQSYEAVMHMYAYTAKSLRLENIVSQQDFPMLFSNNYTRVGDNRGRSHGISSERGQHELCQYRESKKHTEVLARLWQSI
jgi:hypothetical protein